MNICFHSLNNNFMLFIDIPDIEREIQMLHRKEVVR